MLRFFLNFIAFILALGTLITVHEFGHFLIARFCGVTVERFSIGFGHAIWKWQGKFGTEYVIAIIPLGGYVKMLDEKVNETVFCHNCKAFNQIAIWKRASIISAGPVFNFLFTIFLYWIVYLIGLSSYRPVIDKVIPHSIIAQARISPGMELKSINGIKTPDWDSVRLQLLDKIGDTEISINVAPFNSTYSEQRILDLHTWNPKLHKQDPVLSLGIVPFIPRLELILAEVQSNSAAEKAGLQIGDRIVKVNNQAITEWKSFIDKVKSNSDQVFQIEIERQNKLMNIMLKLDGNSVRHEKIEEFIGIVPKVISLPTEYKIKQKFGPLMAACQASQKTWQLIRLTFNMLGKLLTGDVKLKNLSGLISIAQSAGISARHGLTCYLMFLALISVNVGVINLLPLPILDGGHLFFLIIEKLKGKSISKRMKDVSYRIGLILLILLAGLSLFNDFSKL